MTKTISQYQVHLSHKNGPALFDTRSGSRGIFYTFSSLEDAESFSSSVPENIEAYIKTYDITFEDPTEKTKEFLSDLNNRLIL